MYKNTYFSLTLMVLFDKILNWYYVTLDTEMAKFFEILYMG